MRFPSSPFSRKRSTPDLKSSSTSSASSAKSSLASTPEAVEETVAPVSLSVKINRIVNNLSMTSTPPVTTTPTPAPPLSLFVLLPASAHSNHVASPHAQPPRPSPLVSRQSGSTIQTLKSMSTINSEEPESFEKHEIPEIDKVVVAGRRMSLAPGIGSGTQTRSDGSQYAITPSMISFDLPLDESPRRESKAFGSKSLLSTRGGRRRPMTASTAATPISPALGSNHGFMSRGSIAVPNGGFLNAGGGVGKTRPGWEGDEVVGVLRGSGLEVTVIRHASQLPSILSPSTSSPRFGSFNKQSLTPRPKTPTAVTPVILVPLSDSPTIPSLSLLLQQGTTPTAVCFQQDLLDRAKRSEEEWLPAALQQIRTVIEMRDRIVAEAREKSATAEPGEIPIVLAYSANPAIPSTTISACVSAGAAGVLKPPYDPETARFLRRMIRAAREGRISSVVGLPTHLASAARSRSPADDSGRVVLPPTALSNGGEHQGEKVLSDVYHTQRRMSDFRTPNATAGPSLAIRKASIPSIPLPTSTSAQSVLTPTTNRTITFPPTADHEEQLYLEALYTYNPTVQQRRRSVDVAGLGIALRRAQRAFEVVPLAKPRMKKAFETPEPRFRGREEKEVEEDDGHDTQLAELLSAMFYQTQIAIQVQMTEFERFSSPMSRVHHHRLVDAMATWHFKPHHLDDGDLFRAACILFDGVLNSEGLAELQLDRDQIHRLLFAIRAIYHAPNPYHNYVHAIDVLQATYSFLVAIGVAPPFSYLRDMTPTTTPWKRPDESMNPSHGPGSRRARQVLRPQDVLAIVVAAMGHDVGHPGLSNAFMKNAKTPLSQVYDDKSVLENMHCMLIVQLLRKHNLGFLLNPPPRGTKESIPARSSFDHGGFRHLLYSAVLATDMSLHFVWMQDLQNFGEKISQESGIYGKNKIDPGMARDEAVEGDRIMFAQAVIKCADISNPTRPIDVSEYWSSVLLKEWAVQASLETDLDLPVSVIASADAALQAKGQIGFIKLFTQPLFDAVSDVLPEMQCYADWCEENHGLWEVRSEHLKEQAGSEIVQPPVADAAHDERFSTLFPLSLPVSLVTSTCLEPGPTATACAPAVPVRHMKPSEVCMVHADSPSAKAMRAVYHANLLDQRHRLSSWTRGVPIPGVLPSSSYLQTRRSSTPGLAFPSTSPTAAR